MKQWFDVLIKTPIAMKKSQFLSLLMVSISFSFLFGQSPLIIDHNCTDLSAIPTEWVDSAKNKLFIAYGHTSHGSQLTSGMNAMESHFSDGQYDWSHSGGAGELHLFEGDGYGDGYMDHDVGYAGWDDETREYLDLFPECNVIMWSWCGQVNDGNLPSRYFIPMEALETEYPDVKFVYMTGHLEGLGPDGSLFAANQEIRDYCMNNNKILFDFADIEKYSPAADTNFQQYYANDACQYNHPDGGTANWAIDWVNNKPSHELTQIAQYCTSCAHSQGLNCALKGVASWWLWASIAGWQEQNPNSLETEIFSEINLYPNPAEDILYIDNLEPGDQLLITDVQGRIRFKEHILNRKSIALELCEFSNGVYIVQIINNNGIGRESLFVKR